MLLYSATFGDIVYLSYKTLVYVKQLQKKMSILMPESEMNSLT